MDIGVRRRITVSHRPGEPPGERGIVVRAGKVLLVSCMWTLVSAVAAMLVIGVAGGTTGSLAWLLPYAPAACAAAGLWAAWRFDHKPTRRKE